METPMPSRRPLFSFDTFDAADLTVTTGAHEGDAIGLGRDVAQGDYYRLARAATPRRLAICDRADGTQEVADGSAVGQPGAAITIDTCHTLMGEKSEMIDILVITVGAAIAAQRLILPLAPLIPAVDYVLVNSETRSAPRRFADVVSVSFLAGTHLTMAGGDQRPVEDLAAGDMVLTRSHGVQPIRWIGQQTRRAVGNAAPVRVTKGTLNCARDLRLTPQHRLFIWQRRDEVGAGRAEVMVKVAALVNGTTILREGGGHIDTYQIVFDAHEIIYAEGIAVESLLVTGQTRVLLPDDLMLDDTEGAGRDAAAIEMDTGSLPPDAAERLASASKGRQTRD